MSIFQDEVKDVLTILIVCLLMLVAYVKAYNSKYIYSLVSSLINPQNVRQLTVSYNSLNKRPSILTDIIFLLAGGILFYEYAVFNNIPLFQRFGAWLVLIIPVILVAFSFIKHLLYMLTVYTFDNQALYSEYNMFSRTYTRVFGLLLSGVVAIIPYIGDKYVPTLLWCGLILLVSIYIIQIITGVKLILTKLSSLYYLFLYLCALEILPLIAIYRVAF